MTATIVAIVVFVVVTPLVMLVGAFASRLLLGAARYRDLGLPVVVIAVSLLVGAGLGMASFLRLRKRD